MRRQLLIIILIGAVSFLYAVNVAPSVAETIRITNGEWPPFTSEQLPYHGALSRIISEAFALEGVTVEYGFFPWKRAYQHAKTGLWDGSIGWAPSDEHRLDFYLSDPVLIVDKALFHLKSTPFDWAKIDDLSKWRIGAAAGYTYGVEWDLAVQQGRIKIEEVPLDEQNLMKLLRKRIDVMAMEVDVANYLIRTRLSPDEASLIVFHPKLIMQTPICLGLSRQREGSPLLLNRFNHGLRRLRELGRYDAYLRDLRQGPSQ
jgi:polar amino acid transport system substrate-binding protein